MTSNRSLGRRRGKHPVLDASSKSLQAPVPTEPEVIGCINIMNLTDTIRITTYKFKIADNRLSSEVQKIYSKVG
jgi:hypothetical protein